MFDQFNKNLAPKVVKRIILHSFVLAAGIVIAIILLENKTLHNLLEFSNGAGFLIAAFIAGLFFASVFTTTIATASLLILGQNHNPLIVSATAALGSAIGDALILKVIKNDLIEDLEVLTKPISGWGKFLFQSKILHFPLAIVAAIVIASPLPDELGITLLDLIKFKTSHFYILSFTLNFLGIMVITTIGSIW